MMLSSDQSPVHSAIGQASNTLDLRSRREKIHADDQSTIDRIDSREELYNHSNSAGRISLIKREMPSFSTATDLASLGHAIINADKKHRGELVNDPIRKIFMIRLAR